MVVKTAYGEVEGFEEEGIYKWLGVPFAKPPVGELRFRRAQAPDPWEGAWPCKKFATRPIQFAAPPDAADQGSPEGEDCLYLNVWAPGEETRSKAKSPVIIWIYGGAYHAGETCNPGYDLSSFAKHGVVGVSIPYRLGPFGFYLLHESSDRFDSNCGFSDIVAGIKWVHDNIEAFGGDPDNITVCGESAGATMVYCAMATPALKGCFAKAIAMSGLPTDPSSHGAQRIATDMLFELLGLDGSDPKSVEALADMPVDTIRDAVRVVFLTSGQHHAGIPLVGPTVGDDLLPKHVWESIAEGSAEGVSLIAGTCHDEGTLFVRSGLSPATWEAMDEMFRVNGYEGYAERVRELYGDDERTAAEGVARDKMFWAASVKTALAQTAHAPVYAYRYDFVPAKSAAAGLGAQHTSDIVPSLDIHREGSLYEGTPEDAEARIHYFMHGAFLSFCRFGDPGTPLPLFWERFEPERRATMSIAEECHIEYDPHRNLYDFWEGIELYC